MAPSLTHLPRASPPAPWQELHLVQRSCQFPEAIFPILISSLALGFLPFPPPPPGCLPRILTRLLALIKVWLSLGPQILLEIKGATLHSLHPKRPGTGEGRGVCSLDPHGRSQLIIPPSLQTISIYLYTYGIHPDYLLHCSLLSLLSVESSPLYTPNHGL